MRPRRQPRAPDALMVSWAPFVGRRDAHAPARSGVASAPSRFIPGSYRRATPGSVPRNRNPGRSGLFTRFTYGTRWDLAEVRPASTTYARLRGDLEPPHLRLNGGTTRGWLHPSPTVVNADQATERLGSV